jgi:sigma-B regulation protein RsbU (phosphoserine phosphatase)
LVPDAFALGMFDFATFQSRPLHLEDGYIQVIYSNGLTDAQNRENEMFGEVRLLKIIREAAPSSSCALKEKLLKSIEEFTDGAPQTDDITC